MSFYPCQNKSDEEKRKEGWEKLKFIAISASGEEKQYFSFILSKEGNKEKRDRFSIIGKRKLSRYIFFFLVFINRLCKIGDEFLLSLRGNLYQFPDR